MQPKKHIERLVDGYTHVFGRKPIGWYRAPLEEGDHPELDDSELPDEDLTQKYLSLIGSFQWLVSLGRFDTHAAVMTPSKFRSAPRRGHPERARRVMGHACAFQNATIKFCTNIPDHSDTHVPTHDWEHSIHGNAHDEWPPDAPYPMGHKVITTHYVDANLLHDIITGRSVNGVLHCVNDAPIDWVSRCQPTVETATCGSELVAAKNCTEQLEDPQNTLRHLGAPVFNCG